MARVPMVWLPSTPMRADPYTTPGINVAACAKFRPLSGSSTIFLLSTTDPSVASSVLSSGSEEETSTVSACCPTWS